MDSTYFLRQLDIADPTNFKDKPVTVIGAGGVWRQAGRQTRQVREGGWSPFLSQLFCLHFRRVNDFFLKGIQQLVEAIVLVCFQHPRVASEMLEHTILVV